MEPGADLPAIVRALVATIDHLQAHNAAIEARLAALEELAQVGVRDDADRRLVIACIDNARQLGKLLTRVERAPIEGVRLERQDGRRGGARWRCVQVSHV